MTSTLPSELNQAIRLAYAGQKEQAVTRLRQILKQDPNNTQALLWLGGLSPNVHEGIMALERVLQLDPENEAAVQGLAHLRARQQSQAQNAEGTIPLVSKFPTQPNTEETAPSSTDEPPITGAALIRLAGSVIWPFKELKRPLGELLSEGLVQSRDLSWAVQRAFDPEVKWAAAIHLQSTALQTVSLPPAQARKVVWPFKDLNRPMGKLLEERIINLHDLAWAVANAYDSSVREAAAVLGDEIVRRTRSSAAPAVPKTSQTNKQDHATLTNAQQVGQDATLLPQPQIQPTDETPSIDGEALRVVAGSAYLREQEEQKRRQKVFLGTIGLVLTLMAMIGGTVQILLLVLGVAKLPDWWIIVALGIVGIAWLLLPYVEQFKTEQGSFAAGRCGEEKLVELLQQHMDGRWTLFRNVLLPDGEGDIDAVLTGPQGVFALEVKAYTGYNRNVGEQWKRRYFPIWRPLDRSPTRQARKNAARLGAYLKQHGVKVWVKPRVVWAGGIVAAKTKSYCLAARYPKLFAGGYCERQTNPPSVGFRCEHCFGHAPNLAVLQSR
jgi:hypothetical protein